ncbi:NB-ARC domain-containing protein [Fischerella sp. PCC 9605]|uniref:NB-ARC domain-containing protein n=1 Tax=Fischerella sp. PCC 9605 TaxID=1173024 RepID=UPI0004BA0A6D|nr:NB-ARC domain-containing protein [Fischerella sp. PCC 9605]
MEFEEVFKALDAIVFAKAKRHLKDVERFVLWGAWLGQTYEEMAGASNYRYTPSYLKQGVGPRLWRLISEVLGEEICKTNFRTALERQTQLGKTLQTEEPDLDLFEEEHEEPTTNRNQDWGEAIDVSVFYGRNEELVTLKRWIVEKRCRLVALLGMGGIGKTALAVKLAEQVRSEFNYLIWRSLRNAPSIQVILTELLQFLSHQQQTYLPSTLDGKLAQLINYLRQYRCLLILDNVETILRSGDLAGYYLEGYEGYGELLRCVGEVRHQSSLILTSREKPRALAFLEGETPVRSLKLMGLKEAEGREIFKVKGSFAGSEDEWKILIQHYAGNPLVLKMVAPAIQAYFDSSVSKFVELLSQEQFVFDDIRNFLETQFNRLSDLEKEIMYWLAINREPVSLQKLQNGFLPKVSLSTLIENLSSLERRSLIERSSIGFTQQTVIMEYILAGL